MTLEPGFMTTDVVCEYLSISRPTLDRWVALGLPSHQVTPRGRRLFARAEIDAWICSRWNQPTAANGGAA